MIINYYIQWVRRKVIWSLILGLITYMVLSYSLTVLPRLEKSVLAATPEVTEVTKGQLLEAAKKEGRIVFYSTKTTEENEALISGFQKKYPFIKVGVYRSSAEKLLTKILMEVRSRHHEGDVYSISGIQMSLLKDRDLLMKYNSPEAIAYPSHFKDPDGYWVSMVSNTYVWGYNTRLVSPKDVPKTYEDLLHPKWKGKIGMDTEEYEWFATMLEYWGEQKGKEFMRKLASQNLQFRKGHTLLTQLIIAGEFPLSITYGWSIEREKTKGAPLDWVKTVPVVINLGPIAVAVNAPHPNAAKLFYDWVLSREGQETVRRFNRIPCRVDMEPEPPSLTKEVQLVPSNVVSLASRYKEIVQEFNQIFLKKVE